MEAHPCPVCEERMGLGPMWLHLIDGHPDSDYAIKARLELLFEQAGMTSDLFPQEA